ncbi:MAG: prepilin-type N-terminal cleavage/methylation domain-containing protein [Candidatus Omnitrophica bacterium]|nr:prepilin-type N-terminal cleavage/methylation domain-containing protein [Candidatus Omnitrophota bacterium]MCB9782927.1 prepilin-type N-terminal cleavage/methylation domain-containing protein [Candidatus Omnitrophota bacterium]
MREIRRGGFTLLELLIVIAIVLILIAIALPNFLEARIRANVARANSDIRTLVTGLEAYFADWGNYPSDHYGQYPDESIANPETTKYGFTQMTTPIAYLSRIPLDPFGHTDETATDSMGMSYQGCSGSDMDETRPCPWSSSPSNCGCGTMIGPLGIHYPRHNRGCVHAYMALSRGPSRSFTIGPNQWPYASAWVQNNLLPVFFTYAPTNGSKSRGNLYSMVGEWREGYFVLDGYRLHGHR